MGTWWLEQGGGAGVRARVALWAAQCDLLRVFRLRSDLSRLSLKRPLCGNNLASILHEQMKCGPAVQWNIAQS